MSFVYYSSEPREYGQPKEDDEDNLQHKWPTNPTKTTPSNETELSSSEAKPALSNEATTITYPNGLCNDWYIQGYKKRDYYCKDTPYYWEWERLRRYAQAVLEFYKACASRIKQKYDIPLADWEISKQTYTDEDLGKLADKVEDAEINLVDRFDRSNKDVAKSINKYAPLKELQNYAALSWIYYHIVNGNIYVKCHQKMKQQQREFISRDTDNDYLQLLNLITKYARCMNKQFVPECLGKTISEKNLTIAKKLYSDEDNNYIDLKQICADFYKQVDAFTYENYVSSYESIKPRLDEIGKDELNNKIIKFLKKRKEILDICGKIKDIVNKFGNNAILMFEEKYGDREVNILDQAKNYYLSCKDLYSKLTDEYFSGEVKSVISKIIDTFVYIKPYVCDEFISNALSKND